MGNRGWRRYLVLGGLIAFIAGSVAAGSSHAVQTAVKTALLIPHILPHAPLLPLTMVTKPSIREEVRYPYGSSQVVADLYRPRDEGRHGAVIMLFGMNPAERTDPRVVRLADGLARAGVVVLFHDSPDLRQNRIVPQEIDALVAAFEYLRGQEFVDEDKVGFAGFCVGASLAVVAAEDRRISEDVAFVNFFGGYYDALDLIRAIVTETAHYAGREEPWQPTELTVAVFTQHLIQALEDPHERDILTTALLEREGAEKRLSQLSPPGRAVYELLTDPDPAKVEELIGCLPSEALENLRRLSPRSGIDRLQARIYIMHDREDAYVPYVESRRLADAIGDQSRAYYTEFAFFEHVEPTKPLELFTSIKELAKLYLHLYRIMWQIS